MKEYALCSYKKITLWMYEDILSEIALNAVIVTFGNEHVYVV